MQVSVIMPYYNAAKYILETVDCVICQTFKDWELLIVDDCSSAPNTEEILQKVAAMDERIKVLRSKNNGGAGMGRKRWNGFDGKGKDGQIHLH